MQRRVRSWWVLIPLALVTWVFVHESGVHATVAGVLLGFMVPVLRNQRDRGPDSAPGMAEHFEHLVRPLSAGFAIPVFAFFAAGVTFGGYDGLVTALRDPIALGIVTGLVVGKTDRRVRHHPAAGRVHPCRRSTRHCAGSTFSVCGCWPGSDSPYPC